MTKQKPVVINGVEIVPEGKKFHLFRVDKKNFNDNFPIACVDNLDQAMEFIRTLKNTLS